MKNLFRSRVRYHRGLLHRDKTLNYHPIKNRIGLDVGKSVTDLFTLIERHSVHYQKNFLTLVKESKITHVYRRRRRRAVREYSSSVYRKRSHGFVFRTVFFCHGTLTSGQLLRLPLFDQRDDKSRIFEIDLVSLIVDTVWMTYHS